MHHKFHIVFSTLIVSACNAAAPPSDFQQTNYHGLTMMKVGDALSCSDCQSALIREGYIIGEPGPKHSLNGSGIVWGTVIQFDKYRFVCDQDATLGMPPNPSAGNACMGFRQGAPQAKP